MPAKFTIEFPDEWVCSVNRVSVIRAAGGSIAKRVRERLSSGSGASGRMPMKDDLSDANQPLNDTGQMIESVKFKPKFSKGERSKTQGFVFPSGNRSDGKRNAGILAMNLATRSDLDATDPMGVTDAIRAAGIESAQKEIKRQADRKDGVIKPSKRKKKVQVTK